jgi:hypothetical protein
MAVTPFMNLVLPTPSVTLGPEWADALNTALNTVDEHDHSDGKGTRVKTAGLDINADLNFNEFSAFGLKSVRLAEQVATLSGSSNALSLFSYAGDLYYTSGAGTPVQLTSGASIIPTPSAVSALTYTPITSSTVIAPTDTFVVMGVSTAAPRTITLPSAALVAGGRIFWIKDETGGAESNPITILPDGSDSIDGALSLTINSAYGCAFLLTNGVDKWMLI